MGEDIFRSVLIKDKLSTPFTSSHRRPNYPPSVHYIFPGPLNTIDNNDGDGERSWSCLLWTENGEHRYYGLTVSVGSPQGGDGPRRTKWVVQ